MFLIKSYRNSALMCEKTVLLLIIVSICVTSALSSSSEKSEHGVQSRDKAEEEFKPPREKNSQSNEKAKLSKDKIGKVSKLSDAERESFEAEQEMFETLRRKNYLNPFGRKYREVQQAYLWQRYNRTTNTTDTNNTSSIYNLDGSHS